MTTSNKYLIMTAAAHCTTNQQAARYARHCTANIEMKIKRKEKKKQNNFINI